MWHSFELLFFTQGFGSIDSFTKHNAITVTNLSGKLVVTIGGQDNVHTTSSCQRLGASIRTSIKYSLSGAVGGQFRIRGDFNRAKGDTTNKNASSAWAYFSVTS